ncbi:hypothetical protein BC938DRAFT_475854, partial [Jimgerdemannia flammicorona]
PFRPTLTKFVVLTLLITVLFVVQNLLESEDTEPDVPRYIEDYNEQPALPRRTSEGTEPDVPRYIENYNEQPTSPRRTLSKNKAKPWLPDEIPQPPAAGAVALLNDDVPKWRDYDDPSDPFPLPPPRAKEHMFFALWFSPKNTTMPDKMRLCLGSFFYHHPNETFRIYSNDLTPATFADFTSRGHRVDVVKFDLPSVFRRCAPNNGFISWVMEGNYLKPRALNRNVHITDALRLCLSYIHGGLYVDTDIFFLTRIDFTDSIAYLNGEGGNCPVPPYELECTPPHTPEIVFRGQKLWLPSAVYFSTEFYALSAGSDFARKGLQHMQVYEDPKCWNCIGPKTFAHVYARMVEQEAKTIPPLIPSCDEHISEFYDDTIDVVARWRYVKHCPYTHLYASAGALKINKKSLLWQLVKDMCVGCEAFL